MSSYQEFSDIKPELERQIKNCKDQGAEDSDNEVTKSESKSDGDVNPLVVGTITALAVGALVFGAFKLR